MAVLFGDGDHNSSSSTYAVYARVLAHSLRTHTDLSMIDLLLFTSSSSPSSITAFSAWRVMPQQPPPPRAAGEGQYAKLLAWNLTAYEAVLVLDLDTLVIGDLAPLFHDWPPRLRRAGLTLAAAIDQPYHWSPRWTPAPDRRFNAGVLLVRPNARIFRRLQATHALLVRRGAQEPMREQSYLNRVLGRSGFLELPPTFNAMITTAYAEPRAWNRFVASTVRILHFTYPKAHDIDACARAYVLATCELWWHQLLQSSSSSRQPPW